MTQILYALLLLSLRLTPPPPASPTPANTIAADPADSPEAVPSMLRAQELYHAREFEAALPVAEEVADRAWSEYGSDDYETISAQEFLAHLAALSKDPDRARAIRRENDRTLERLGNPGLIEKIRITRAEDYRESAESEEKEGE